VLYLAASILSSTTVALLLHRVRPDRRFTTFAVNYVVAVALGMLRSGASASGQYLLTTGEVIVAVVTGLVYVLGFLVFSRTIGALGTGVAASVSRISVSVPVLVSIVIFGETGPPLRIPAIILSVLLLPLAGREWPPWGRAPLDDEPRKRLSGASVLWAFALFAAIGLSDAALKVRQELLPLSEPGRFFSMLFGTAAVAALVIALVRGEFRSAATESRSPLGSILIGIPVGAANFGSAYFLAGALETISGALAYTVNAIGVILLTAVLGMLIHRERPRPHNYIFFAGAIAVVVVLQLSIR
jgi:multidrug transporter EmrE-like cation transporter